MEDGADGSGKGEGASFRLVAKLRIKAKPVVRGVSDDGFYYSIVNYAMITMGGRLTHFEAVVPEDGVLDVDHVFEEIKSGESYYNQMGWRGDPSDRMVEQGLNYNREDDTRIKSHVIVWLFRRRMEKRKGVVVPEGTFREPVKPKEGLFSRVKDAGGDPEAPIAIDEEDLRFQAVKESPLSPVLRCYLIGAEAVDLAALCASTLTITPGSGYTPEQGAEKPETTFPVMHNFCETSASCEIMQVAGGNGLEEMRRDLEALKAGVRRYTEEEEEAAKVPRRPDHSRCLHMPSALSQLPRCFEIVRMQQRIMQYVALRKLKRGELELSDEMGAAFLSGSTYLQLHGMAACFTDMSAIVREVVVEIPFSLLLVHARTAMYVNGMTPEQVCNMRPTDDGANERAFAIYLSTLTCEIMDQRQSGYYSDYCLHGVEEAAEKDYVEDRQPGPSDVDCAGEAWFYRIYRGGGTPKYVRYRLRLTEDQRQVCTGRGLRYGMINDDCETSASFSMAENKTAAAMRSHMLAHGFIDDGDSPSVGKDGPGRDESFLSMWKGLRGLLSNKGNTGQGGATRGRLFVIAQATGVVEANLKEEHVDVFMALANVLRQLDTTMELCIGTANAAAVGAAAQLSGHCYGMCIAHHHSTQETMAMIVEGTRWVMQEQCKRKEDRLMTEEQGNMLNELASILMEMTKIPSIPAIFDAGVGLMRVMREGGKPESFYRSVYVTGCNIIVQRRRGSNNVVVGAPVGLVMQAHGSRRGGCAASGGGEQGESTVVPIRVAYNLVCREIEAQAGMRIRPTAIGRAIVDMARETKVPPWSKKHWEKITKNFNAFTVLWEEPLDESRGREMVRFAFTHQIYRPLTGDERSEFETTIIQGVQGDENGKPHAEITLQHVKNIFGESKGMEAPVEDCVDAAMASLASLPGKIHVERIFLSMNSVVTVCAILPGDIATAHAAGMGWAKTIVEARKSRVPTRVAAE